MQFFLLEHQLRHHLLQRPQLLPRAVWLQAESEAASIFRALPTVLSVPE